MQQTTLVARRSVVSPSNGSPKSDQLGLGGKKNGKKKKAPTHKKMCLTPRPGNPKTGCSNQPARMGPLVAHQRRLVPCVGARGAHRVCLVAQLGLLRARLCAAQEPLRRAADELAGRLRAGGADAQLQPAQGGLRRRPVKRHDSRMRHGRLSLHLMEPADAAHSPDWAAGKRCNQPATPLSSPPSTGFGRMFALIFYN